MKPFGSQGLKADDQFRASVSTLSQGTLPKDAVKFGIFRGQQYQ
jgi:hypothetical protein